LAFPLAGESSLPVPKTPRIARGTPDFRRVGGDANRCKSLAYAAYKKARQTAPIPPALIDRLWSDALAAAGLAPSPNIAATMFRRHEVLCKLLLDQHNWPRS
jgi:hypothetical protein